MDPSEYPVSLQAELLTRSNSLLRQTFTTTATLQILPAVHAVPHTHLSSAAISVTQSISKSSLSALRLLSQLEHPIDLQSNPTTQQLWIRT